MTIAREEELHEVEDVEDVEVPTKRRKIASEEPEKQISSNRFLPPSVKTNMTFTSTTHISEIPLEVIQNPNEPCVLGVDEAGRGPVLGPMVYGVSYCLKDYEKELKSKYGFADSKTLKEETRTELMKKICDKDSDLFRNVGWATRTMTALDISSGMLKPNSVGNYNLNEQAHDATMALVQDVLDQGVNLKELFVDTVGPPASYQAKLSKRFPGLIVTVTKKADALFPCVSTASICAKVTRDVSLHYYKEMLLPAGDEWGSGYPSDPRTSSWLRGAVDPVFGWNGLVRFSWQTAKDCLKNHGGVSVTYVDECKKESYSVEAMMERKEPGSLEAAELSTLWYGRDTSL